MSTSRRVITIAALAFTSACVGSLKTTQMGPVATDHGDVVKIDVSNDRLAEVKVYLVHLSSRRPLGYVGPGKTARFTVSASSIVDRDMRLAVVPVHGGIVHASDPIMAQPGQRLVFRLKDNGTFRFPDPNQP